MRLLGCSEEHGPADCAWREEPCCQQCLVLAARAAHLRRPSGIQVHENEVDAGTQALAASREIRQEAKLIKPRKRRSRFVSYNLYLRPDQIVDLARICAASGLPTSQFCRDAIDKLISLHMEKVPPAVPLLRGKSVRVMP